MVVVGPSTLGRSADRLWTVVMTVGPLLLRSPARRLVGDSSVTSWSCLTLVWSGLLPPDSKHTNIWTAANTSRVQWGVQHTGSRPVVLLQPLFSGDVPLPVTIRRRHMSVPARWEHNQRTVGSSRSGKGK